MWDDVLSRLDTKVTVAQAVQLWQGEVASIQLISQGINWVYRFRKNKQDYYLRLTHQQLCSQAAIEDTIRFQKHLFDHGVPVCQPVLSDNEQWVEALEQQDDLFLAHVCQGVPGEPINFQQPKSLYYRWGQILAQFHQASAQMDWYSPHFDHWQSILHEMQDYAARESTFIQDKLTQFQDFFAKRQQTSDNYGLTHADHRDCNVLTDGQQIHIIDFDVPCYNWFLEDFARPFIDPIVFDYPNWQAVLTPYYQGYLSIRPASTLNITELPHQIEFKCLELYLWVKNNWSGATAPGGANTQDWLNKLYQRLQSNEWQRQLWANIDPVFS